jgi:hypothetical protein
MQFPKWESLPRNEIVLAQAQWWVYLAAEFATMNSLSPERLAQLELTGFVYGLAAIVALRMLTGSINMRGLLRSKDAAQGVSPLRVQLLLATLLVGGQVLRQIATAQGSTMPDISRDWLLLFGGSSGAYAAGKVAQAWAKLRQ